MVEIGEVIKQYRDSGFKPNDNRIYINIPDARTALMKGLVRFCGEQTQWLPEYEKVAEWLGDNKGRGLLCFGNCGRGKTLITQRIIPVLINFYNGKVLNTITAADIGRKYDEISECKLISIDDVGVEDVSNLYGEKHDYFRELVDVAERKQKLLVISTNLTLKEIAERYGDRTIDRLRAITTTVLFEGDSLRR